MLPGMEQDEKRYPFLTMVKDDVRYKVFGIVTNMDRMERGLCLTFVVGFDNCET